MPFYSMRVLVAAMLHLPRPAFRPYEDLDAINTSGPQHISETSGSARETNDRCDDVAQSPRRACSGPLSAGHVDPCVFDVSGPEWTVGGEPTLRRGFPEAAAQGRAQKNPRRNGTDAGQSDRSSRRSDS